MTIERLYSKQGVQLNGFFVRNRAGKVVGIGAFASPAGAGFLHPANDRIARDIDICRRMGELAGVAVSVNLSFYCGAVSSHGPQMARALWRRKHPAQWES